jgi:Family of unknown function (DUF5518)
MVVGSWVEILGGLIATIYVGYTVGGNYKNGAIHGARVGIILSIISIIFFIGMVGLIFIVGSGANMGAEYAIRLISENILLMIIQIFGTIIIIAIGGVLGVFIKLNY